MHLDGKTHRLAALAPGASQADLLALARLVELTEFRAGDLVAPAGLPGRWATRLLTGIVASTAPPARHEPGALLLHGPETALIALTDVELLTVGQAHLHGIAQLAPGLITRSALAG